MKFGHLRGGRWVTTTPEGSLRSFVRQLPAAAAMGFLSPSGFRAGTKVMREIRRQSDYMSFASDSPLAEIDDGESFGDYLQRMGVPEKLQVTLSGPLKMILGDPAPAGQALMRAYIGETMLSDGEVFMPERGIGSLNAALAAECADVTRVAAPVSRIVVADGKATGVVAGSETIEADVVICAVPGTKVTDLVPELPAAVRKALGTVSYSTGCRVVIGLDRSPLPAGWHGAIYAEDHDAPLLMDRSKFLPACAPPGHSILDLLIGRDRAKELFPLDDETIKRELLGAARRNAPPGSALPGDDEGPVLPRLSLGRSAVHGRARDARRAGRGARPARRQHRQPVPGRRLHGHPVGQRRPVHRRERRQPRRRSLRVSHGLVDAASTCKPRQLLTSAENKLRLTLNRYLEF